MTGPWIVSVIHFLFFMTRRAVAMMKRIMSAAFAAGAW